jgi:ATP-dependent RNA helicase DeaD
MNEQEHLFTEPTDPLPSVAIDDLPPRLQEAVRAAGWPALTPVQSKAMPYLFAGRDMMVQARTGSGKTGAFVMPILERINPLEENCQALILVPTRELARQVEAEATMLSRNRDNVRVTAVYGGVSYGPQLKAFREGAHVVVGTPGRILDHLINGNLKLDNLKLLIFDEADRMLSMGFYPDMVEVQRFLPDRALDSFMFSATFTPRVIRLANVFLDEPELLSLSQDTVHVTETDHVFYTVPAMEKDRALIRIIEIENPVSALIFCNTRQRVHYVTVVLRRFGYNADELSSDLTQQARENVLGQLREGKLRFLVATDVAARGIDVPELSHVFQYELSDELEGYIHRAGRTGRAGATGEAISLVAGMEKVSLHRIGKQYEVPFEERPLPTDEDVAKIVGERLINQLEGQLRQRDNLKVERMQRFLPLARDLSESEEGLSLLAMLLDDSYHQSLHDPPAQPDVTSVSRGRGRDSGDRRGRGQSKSRRRRR